MNSSQEVPNRENQCRFCLKSSKSKVKLTKILMEKFMELTQIELQINDKLSNFICSKCEKQFKNAYLYRENLIKIQNNLLKEISENFLPELINVKEEVIEDVNLNEIVNVKQEMIEIVEFGEYLFDDYENINLDVSLDVKNNDKINEFKCDYEGCEEEFPNKTKLKNHLRIHRPPRTKSDRSRMCSYCGVKLSNKWSLQLHVNSVHLKVQKYFCDLCGYIAAHRCLIRSHMKTHLDISERKMYSCETCEFKSLNLASLKRHEMNEHKGVTFPCHCGKVFKYLAALKAHNKIVHLKIKNFECDCGKKFFCRAELNDHQILSHGKKATVEYTCDQCGKQFPTRKQLMRHKPYHTEVKFNCTYEGCDKSYVTKLKLTRHMKQHTGKRDLECHLCDKAYFYTRDLQRHLDVVHKKTTFFCELCAFTNNRKDYLCNHIKSAHSHISAEERNKMVARAKFIRNPV